MSVAVSQVVSEREMGRCWEEGRTPGLAWGPTVEPRSPRAEAEAWNRREGPPRGDIPVSPHTGRYSSCWMSSMISSPLPVPPFMVFSGGRPSRPELNV